MENRIALIGIIVENSESVGSLNSILADAARYVVGRMGIPYRERGVNVISIVMDAPNDVINTVSGKLGKLDGVSVKTMYSKI